MDKITSMSILKIAKTLLLCFLLFTTSIAFAEKQEWVDNNYNFNKVKKVLILTPTINSKLYNGVNEHQILDIFTKKAQLPANVKVLTLEKIVENIKSDTGVDIALTYKNNPQEAFKLLNEGISRYVDILITSRVFEYSIGSEYREGYTYSTTEYQTAYVNNNLGQEVGSIDVPVNTSHSVPGGNIPVAYASVRWDVKDVKAGKLVITRLDDRAKGNPTVFANTKPKDLYGRIAGSFFDFLSDKLEVK